LQLLMTEHIGDFLETGATIDHLCGGGVTQQMRP
jgi:hypothetical protein